MAVTPSPTLPRIPGEGAGEPSRVGRFALSLPSLWFIPVLKHAIHMMTYATDLPLPRGRTPRSRRRHAHVGEASFVVIAGPRGCGKSTLGPAIAVTSTSRGELLGAVRVRGLDVASTRSLRWRTSSAGAAEPENQFSPSVRDEVAFGLGDRCLSPALIASLCDEALHRGGASGRPRPGHPVGGEKQKVAVASMLARARGCSSLTSLLQPRPHRHAAHLRPRRRAPPLGVTIVHRATRWTACAPLRRASSAWKGAASWPTRPPCPPTRPFPAREPAQRGSLARVEPQRAYDARGAGRRQRRLCGGAAGGPMGDNGSGKSTLCALSGPRAAVRWRRHLSARQLPPRRTLSPPQGAVVPNAHEGP